MVEQTFSEGRRTAQTRDADDALEMVETSLSFWE